MRQPSSTGDAVILGVLEVLCDASDLFLWAGGGALSWGPRVSASREGVVQEPHDGVVAPARRPRPSKRVLGKGVVGGGAELELLEQAEVVWGSVSGKSDAAGKGVRGKRDDFRSPDLFEKGSVGGTEGIAGEGEELEVDVPFRSEDGGR